MKLEIYKGSDEPEEKVVRLSLRPVYHGSPDIVLCAVDEHGDIVGRGNLLTIHAASGVIGRNPAVNSSLGFQLDAAGRVRVEDR